MGKPNMECMIVNIWIHHMQVGELFDFLNNRIDEPPNYWYSESSVPRSVTGGYVMISLPFESYSNLSSPKYWDEAPGWIKK